LAPGRHSIEVVRPGFETLERAVDIEPDGRIEVDAELRPTGS
jgi:PEGA domain